jgi:hypothetical protein
MVEKIVHAFFGEISNHKHQISNKFQIRNINDQKQLPLFTDAVIFYKFSEQFLSPLHSAWAYDRC